MSKIRCKFWKSLKECFTWGSEPLKPLMFCATAAFRSEQCGFNRASVYRRKLSRFVAIPTAPGFLEGMCALGKLGFVQSVLLLSMCLYWCHFFQERAIDVTTKPAEEPGTNGE